MARKKKPNIFTSMKRGINKGISKAKSEIDKGIKLIKDYNNKLNEKDKIIRQNNVEIKDKQIVIQSKDNDIKSLNNKISGPLLNPYGNEVSQPRFEFLKIPKCDNCRESFQQMNSKETPIIESVVNREQPTNYNWNSGLEAKSNAYSTLYNTYLYGYQNAVNVITK